MNVTTKMKMKLGKSLVSLTKWYKYKTEWNEDDKDEIIWHEISYFPFRLSLVPSKDKSNSVSMEFPIIYILCKQNTTVYGLLCLVYLN